jgi:translation initiation factor 1
MNKKKRIDTGGGQSLSQNPFGALDNLDLPSGPTDPILPSTESKRSKPNKNRGRVDIIRQKAHRGGKTVTVITAFKGIGLPEKEALAKKMQTSCGTGGTVKNGNIEIQGDQREKVATILEEAGFRPVFAGG